MLSRSPNFVGELSSPLIHNLILGRKADFIPYYLERISAMPKSGPKYSGNKGDLAKVQVHLKHLDVRVVV